MSVMVARWWWLISAQRPHSTASMTKETIWAETYRLDFRFRRTPCLIVPITRVEVEQPHQVIGTNTVQSMQAGLFFGYVGLVDELSRRCKQELFEAGANRVTCVATGGLARLIGGSCKEIDEVDDDLTLQGLRLLWERNQR